MKIEALLSNAIFRLHTIKNNSYWLLRLFTFSRNNLSCHLAKPTKVKPTKINLQTLHSRTHSEALDNKELTTQQITFFPFLSPLILIQIRSETFAIPLGKIVERLPLKVSFYVLTEAKTLTEIITGESHKKLWKLLTENPALYFNIAKNSFTVSRKFVICFEVLPLSFSIPAIVKCRLETPKVFQFVVDNKAKAKIMLRSRA